MTPEQSIKRLALQGHDHEREQDFFASEIQSLRATKTDTPLGKGAERWWGGLLYEKLSDFGRSAYLPFQWWLITLAASVVVYSWPQLPAAATNNILLALSISVALLLCILYPLLRKSGQSFCNLVFKCVSALSYFIIIMPLLTRVNCLVGDGSALTNALFLSLKRSLIGLGLNNSEHQKDIVECLYKSGTMPYLHSFWGIGQMLFSLVLIFLFLLAVRAKFRIK
ncbi:MAG: hypothetical protein LW855_03550 [Alphaproteobacteria bacterium]|jgi:hypothetical protein|nr:hypothetical protein [Alphaproteobacteria bacterium]